MTREEIKEAAKVMEAYANGKKIQCNDNHLGNGEWVTTDNPSFNWDKYAYRIKPESKYRPFKTQEECWNEMLKHQPFGFVVSKDSIDYSGICRVFKDEKGISRITFTSNPYSDWDMEIAFYRINFADGTPFGIKEE